MIREGKGKDLPFSNTPPRDSLKSRPYTLRSDITIPKRASTRYTDNVCARLYAPDVAGNSESMVAVHG